METAAAVSHEGPCSQAAIIIPSILGPVVGSVIEPIVKARQPGRVTSHPVAASDGGTIIAHARGIRLEKAGPILISACRSHKGKRSTYPDPTRSIGPRGIL